MHAGEEANRSLSGGIDRLTEGYYHPAMKLLTIKIPDVLYSEISAEAAAKKVSRSEIARRRLASPAPAKGGSLWDRMKDLVIDDAASPRDLSTNKKRMKGYGQSRAR